MRPEYSDLEPVRNDNDAPEVYRQPEDKVVVRHENETNEYKIYEGKNVVWTKDDGTAAVKDTHGSKQRPTWRCCGLQYSRRSWYWIVAAVLLLVIAGAIGGGVGGSLSSRNNESGANSPADNGSSLDSTASPTTTTSQTTSATLTTSTIIANPTETVYRDCPSSNYSVYAVGGQAADSPPLLFRKFCSYGLLGDPGPDSVDINQRTQSLDDCISLCVAQNTLNATAITRGEINPCNSVCWRNGNQGDDFPYQCFGTYRGNLTDGFPITRLAVEENCDVAMWMNQDVAV